MIQFYKPQSKLLQRYIEGYYFVSPGTDAPMHYLTFPNNFVILSVSQDCDVMVDTNRIIAIPSLDKKMNVDLVVRYKEPIEVYYEKAINEVTLYFKPLGINNFLGGKTVSSAQKCSDAALLFPGIRERMEQVFTIADRNLQVNEFEEYWLSLFQEADGGIVSEIVLEVEADLKIDVIARKHKCSRQHINKVFMNAVGKSPSEYRKIHRFRTAIAGKGNFSNLTELSHASLFYDQSHFIKDFQQLASLSPAAFFKNADTKSKRVWLFI